MGLDMCIDGIGLDYVYKLVFFFFVQNVLKRTCILAIKSFEAQDHINYQHDHNQSSIVNYWYLLS